MTTQEFLTFLIDAIVLSFVTLMLVDFVSRLIELARTSATSSQQILASDEITKIFDAKPEIEQLPTVFLPDPWFLPIENEVREIATPKISMPQIQTPLLLLPFAEPVSLPHEDNESNAVELFHQIDFDKLQLRSARKIAKLLEIPQKVNGRDQKLSDLKSEIKIRFQQTQLLPEDAIDLVRALIAI